LSAHTVSLRSLLFFLTDPAPTEIYTLSLHDALPISTPSRISFSIAEVERLRTAATAAGPPATARSRERVMGVSLARVRSTISRRSEEHTSELQSRENLVCRLLLEKKKKTKKCIKMTE